MNTYRVRLQLGIAFLAAISMLATGCGKGQESTGGPSQDESATPQQGEGQTTGQQATQAPVPRRVTLETGTPISIVTATQLSTKDQKTGDPFAASLAEDLAVGDWVIAKAGAEVKGIVANADPGGRVQGVASLSVRLQALTLADGRTLDIKTGVYAVKARSTKKKDAVRIGIGAGVGSAIGAIAGGGKGAAIGAAVGGGAGTAATVATRGEPAVIPAESKIAFKLGAPVEVAEQK